MVHHADGLARAARSDSRRELASAVRDDWTSAPLTDRERVLCEHAAKLTKTPGSMTEDDLEPMRAAGLTERELLDANLVVAYFAFVNRIADGLGVALEPERQG